MGDIIAARFSRRNFLRGSLAVSAIAATVSPIALITAETARAASGSAFSFDEVEAGVDETHHVAAGYDADVLLRWGDPIFADSPAFDPANQTPESQEKQFGYNNDYVGFIPIDGSAEHGLLVVNHEYTTEHLMFPGIVTITDGKIDVAASDARRVGVEMAAHGGTHRRDQEGRRQVAGRARRQAQPPHHRQHRNGTHRPGGRKRPAENRRRRHRHQGVRHLQQLRRRRDALGHLCDGGGEHPRLFHRRTAGGPPRDRQPQAHGRAGRRLPVGEFRGPLRHLQGAERAEPIRLDRGGRRERPELRAEETHRAGALQA